MTEGVDFAPNNARGPAIRTWAVCGRPDPAHGFGLAIEALQVHALFGAFLAGVVTPGGGLLETGLRQRLHSVTIALLLPLFFAYNGLRTSVTLLNAGLWAVCGLVVPEAWWNW